GRRVHPVGPGQFRWRRRGVVLRLPGSDGGNGGRDQLLVRALDERRLDLAGVAPDRRVIRHHDGAGGAAQPRPLPRRLRGPGEPVTGVTYGRGGSTSSSFQSSGRAKFALWLPATPANPPSPGLTSRRL